MKTGKKLLSLLLSLLLVLGTAALGGMSVSAEGEPCLLVGGEVIDTDNGGTYYDGKVVYDALTNTLILNGLELEIPGISCIYAAYLDLTITGSAKLASGTQSTIYLVYGNLTLDGMFALHGTAFSPLSVDGNLTVNGGTVYVKNENSSAIYAESIIFNNGERFVKGDRNASEVLISALRGEGTADSPYEISSYAELKEFASIVNGTNVAIEQNAGAYAKLMNDIDAGASASANDWTPVGNSDNFYTGIFDGNGYVITGLTFNDSSFDYAGFFGYVGSKGTVRNVGLEGGSITGEDFVGGIAGYIDYGTVANCYNSGSVTATGNIDYVGGIAGRNDSGTIINCYNTGNVTAAGNNVSAGGIAGRNDAGGTVRNCYNTGTVTATGDDSSSGGIAGHNDGRGTIRNCYNTGTVTASGNNSSAGGVIGYSGYNSPVTNCYYDKSVCGDIGAAGGRDIETKKLTGLTTAQMTGADALSSDNMFFEFEQGEENPWLVKENTCLKDFYPHLTGFAYDNDATDENWPPKTETGTGVHKYGETGDDRYTCAVCGKFNEDLKAAEELAANKEEYNRYKEQKLGEIDAMAQEGDSQQCSDIISGAKMLVAMLYYNENITLDENKSVIDAVISTLIDSLEEHRKVYHVLFVDENGTTVDEVPYTIDTVSIDEPEVPAKEGYDGAWEEYKLTNEDITVKPVYTPANICKLDGEYHGDTFFGKLITFFHNLIWTAFSFIGLDIFFSIKRG